MDELGGEGRGNGEQATTDPESVPSLPERGGSLSDDPDIDALREFFRASGGSVLFALSAVSIFLGLSAVVGPALGTSYVLADTLPAIGAIGLYELCLFAVMFALVLRWSITRDTVSLLVLVAVFLVTLGHLVSTVANDDPVAVFGVGAAVFVVALAQLVSVRRRIGVPFGGLSILGVALVLAWNCLNATALAYYIGGEGVRDARMAIDLWRYTIGIPIAGAALCYVDAVIAPTGSYEDARRHRAFLRTPGMAWVFVGTLLGGTLVHQYAMGYIFDLPQYVVDYVPLIAIASLTFIEIARGYGRMTREAVVAAGILPLSAIVIALVSTSYDAALGLGRGIGVPLIATATVTATAFAGMALRHRRAEFLVLGGVHVFVAGLLGFPESSPGGIESIDWHLARASLAVLALPFLIALRNPTLWAVAVAIAAVAAPAFAPFRDIVGYERMDEAARGAARGIVFGLGTVALALVFGARLHRAVLWAGAIVLTVCVMHFMFAADTFSPQAAFAAGTAVCAGLVFWRVRDGVSAVILAAPSLRLSYDALHDAGGWRYILLGFALLAIGAVWSVRSQRNDAAEQRILPADET